MNEPKKAGARDFLFDPFTRTAGAKSLIIGITAIFVAGLLGEISNTHLDGVLDVHTGREAPLVVFLAEGMINWICAVIVFFIIAKIIVRTRFRIIDLAGTQAMARWPAILICLMAMTGPFQRTIQKFEGITSENGVSQIDMMYLGVIAIITLLIVIWMVVLMYQSFSISCNIRGKKGIISFGAGLIVAEFVSKVALAYFSKLL